MLRPIEVLKLTLLDSKEYSFLLSSGGVKRLKEKLKVEVLNEILNRDVIDCGIPTLWEALLDKPEGLTEAAFADLLPADPPGLTKAVLKLLGLSLPDPESRPIGGAAEATPEAPKTAIQ